tara:strand:- start:4192 stop:5151 length:960 start_codon:yes stop_codon:yes gene_type:complete
MKKTVDLQVTDPVGITGAGDSNLRLIESAFSCKILLRGTTVHLEGKKLEINLVEEILQEMMKTYTRKNHLNESDVKSLIALVSEGEHGSKNGQESVILYTKDGAVTTRTEGQRRFFKMSKESEFNFAIGPAGTGKTYLAVAFALAAYKNREVKRIILSRPAVEAGERLGFLPGDLREKIDPYLAPLYDALHDMLPTVTLKSLTSKKQIEVIPLAYMRGRTLSNAFVILDEAQNCSTTQMKMFLTRLGPNSRAIINGDVTQIDLPSKEESGLLQAERILRNIDGIGFVYFTENDVVRHRLVKNIIKAYSDENNGEKGGKD